MKKLIDVVAYINKVMIEELPLRFVVGRDKLSLYLYLCDRRLLEATGEALDVEYGISLHDDGSLVLEADIGDILHHTYTIRMEPDYNFPSLTKLDIKIIRDIIKNYGDMDYYNLIKKMMSKAGNTISPELSEITKYPYIMNKEDFIELVSKYM